MPKESPLAPLQGWIRARFPQLERDGAGRARVYLDNAAGTLMPATVADAMREAALWLNAQPGRSWPAARATATRHALTRDALRDFLGAAPEDPIYFDTSTTAALFKLRVALEPHLEGGAVIVSDGDHYANISAWEFRPAWELRRARMRPEDGALDLDHLAALLGPRTRLVALTAATNGLGTRFDLPAAARLLRERAPEALLVVDAVHLAPHAPIDVAAIGCDALAFSPYKLFGPYCGVLWLRGALADRLDPYRVEPHTDRETLFETGTLDNVAVAGVGAALAYLREVGEKIGEPTPPAPRSARSLGGRSAANGGPGRGRSRRELLRLAMEAIRDHEAALSRRVLSALRERADLRGVTLFGVAGLERVEERVPTFALAVAGVSDEAAEARLWEDAGLQVAAGSHYAASVQRGLGRPGVLRASFAHYNTARDADLLLDALARLAAGPTPVP